MNLSIYFILFIIYSFIGWIIEIIDIRIETKKWINRGFLIGPYCPIYGCGAILMTFLLKKYYSDPVALFFMGMIICSILEYITSYLMEKIFKARWWDYSEKKFNINGRVCLETMIPFGLLGCLLIYLLNPFFTNVLLKVPMFILNIIAAILFIIFLIDNIISFSIISKISISSKKLIKDNTEEITNIVKEHIFNNSKLGKRVIKSFPKFKVLRKKKENK